MEITITPKPKPIINTAPICNNFTTGNKTNSYSISNYTSIKYTFAWKCWRYVKVQQTISQLIKLNYTLTVTDYLFLVVHQIPLLLPLKKYPPHISHLHYWDWFSDRQTVIINATPTTGDGSNFLYSIDGGIPQTSNIFTAILSGVMK
jgi:hypothetical protein